MYFLSDEERSLVAGKLLPEARQQGVHPELRGWSWQQPPILPVYDLRLTVDEVADKACDSGRELYLRRVMHVGAELSRERFEEMALQHVLADVLVRAKQVMYEYGPNECLRHLVGTAEAEQESLGKLGVRVEREALPAGNGEQPRGELTVVERRVQARDQAALVRKVAALAAFESQRIVGRVQEVLAREPDIGADALVTLALPVTIERKLNGTFVGLALHQTAPAVGTFEGMVFDVRFGRQQEFHRLTTTSYALILESLYGYPVDIGCVVYVSIAGERVSIERDLHVIDDELRQWLIEERDERARLVSEEIDPGMATECYASCACWEYCHVG